MKCSMLGVVWYLVGVLGVVASLAPETSPATSPASTRPATQPATRQTWGALPALGAPLTLVNGTPLDLMQFKGRVVVLVPVAWDANRRQFEDLELYNARIRDRGAVVIAVLTADFGKETRSDKELEAAIRERYKLTIPLAATTRITGPDAHPAFAYFASTTAGHAFGGEIKGAFTKFVIDRNGELAGRWEPAHRINNNDDFRAIIDIINTPIR